MTRFEEFKSMDIKALTEWICKYGELDGSPWMTWWDSTYCKNCEPVMCHYPDSEYKFPCGWCELEHKCTFFPEMDGVPSVKDIVKLWLEGEVK